ncbi:MAG TPA: WD40 repeat domain-containing protein, partial [Phototrophicaceae bacterium]|nr:WD40 repeat domain-containing protein [Phototrophicaceae bacterium]
KVLDTGLNLPIELEFSPGCRYLEGQIATISDQGQAYDASPLDDTRRDRVSHFVIIWDTVTGQRVFETSNPAKGWGANTVTNWSPGGDRVLIQTSRGTSLVNLSSGQSTLLAVENGSDPGFRYLASYWDYPRGQVFIGGNDGVYAFDLTTGVERNWFYAGKNGGWCRWQCGFGVRDNKTLLVFGSGSGTPSIGIWNLDTLEHQFITTSSYSQIIFGGSYLALSPDGHYVVMVWENIRVWDLTQPYAGKYGGLRNPVNSFPLYQHAESVQFIDNVTVEIEMRDGSRIQMNMETGVSTSIE